MIFCSCFINVLQKDDILPQLTSKSALISAETNRGFFLAKINRPWRTFFFLYLVCFGLVKRLAIA